MAFDISKLLELAPLALMKPGSPEGAAMLAGYQQSLQRMQQQKQFQHREQRQDELASAQMANLNADNLRANEQLEMQRQRDALARLTASRREGLGALETLQQQPETELPAGIDPLQAQNALVVDQLGSQQAYGVPPGTPQTRLPNMTALISEAKKRRAKALYADLTEQFGKEAMANDSVQPRAGEFKDQKPSQLRALFSAPAVNAQGLPATPYVKPPASVGTKSERAQQLLEQIDDATAAGNMPGVARFRRQYDNLLKAERELGQAGYHPPRDASARDVTTAREQAYQALLNGGMDSDYNGVELNVRKRLSNRWTVMGGVGYGKNTGDIYNLNTDRGDLNNPNFTFRRGVLAQDVPLSLKAVALYELPYGISVSGSGQYFSGFPEIDTVSVGRDTVALTQVTQVLTVAESGTSRLPSVKLFDLSVRRAFKSGRTSIEPVIDLFNLGNAGTITSRATQLGPTYHRVTGILRARMVKFGVNVNF
jgi:hypothetical protein